MFLHTHKRKRLGDLTVTHLTQGIKDLELTDLKIIVSCLPSAFQFYFPRQIVPISSFHHHHASSSLNLSNSSSFEQLCLDVKVDGPQLMSLVSQFHQLCKTEVNTRFKMIQLPQLATYTNTTTTNASQTNNNNNSTTSVTSSSSSSSLSKMVMNNENVENVEKTDENDDENGNGNGNEDILSKETLKRLKQNEKKRKLHSVMDRDLKRRIQYSKMLSVAQLIHTIFQMENRSRMRLNQLKTEIVNRAVNSEIANMSRADVTRVLYQLTQVPLPEERRWCRIETLSLDHEKVFVVVNHQRGEVQDGNGGENNKSDDASGSSSSSRRRSSGVGSVGGNRGVVGDEDAMLVEMMMRRSKQQDDRERRENEAFSVLKQYLEQELKKRVYVNEDGEVVETTTMTTTAMKQQDKELQQQQQQEQQEKQE